MKTFLNLKTILILVLEFTRKINIKNYFLSTRTMKRFGSQTFNNVIVNQCVCDP